MTVDTGCSTALVALHQAVLGLRTREADMSIVSVCNIMLSPDMFKSYAFDSRANGYGRGEGAATVIVKRLAEALRDGDPAISSLQEAQEALIRECYRRAGLSPSDTQYFEAHGIGAPTGDPIEARSIASVFGEGSRAATTDWAASGLAGLIKVLVAMEKGFIPPSVNSEKPNPKLKLDEWK
ncbi:thiolase-like protein [Aspergillus desertorum]